MRAQSLSRVWLSATPRTAVRQAPLSLGFPRQESWSELPFPSPGDLPNPGIEPRSPALQVDSLLLMTFKGGIAPELLLISSFVIPQPEWAYFHGIVVSWSGDSPLNPLPPVLPACTALPLQRAPAARLQWGVLGGVPLVTFRGTKLSSTTEGLASPHCRDQTEPSSSSKITHGEATLFNLYKDL